MRIRAYNVIPIYRERRTYEHVKHAIAALTCERLMDNYDQLNKIPASAG